MSKFKGGRVGSVKKLKKSLDTSGTWVRYIKEDDSVTVRFLTEPDDWFRYYEHYDPVTGFHPCIGDECPSCESPNERVAYAAQRYLANVLMVEEARVVPLKLPKDLANRVVARFERYGTLLDRDYTLSRTGTFKDVLYDVDAEAPSAVDLAKHELLDLEAVLEEQVDDAMGGDDEPKPAPKKKAAKKAAKKATPKNAPEPVDVDDDDEVDDDEVPSEGADEEEPEGTIVSAGVDDDDEDDDEEVIELTEDELLGMSVNDLKDIAVQVGVDITPSMRKSALVDAILDAAEVVEE